MAGVDTIDAYFTTIRADQAAALQHRWIGVDPLGQVALPRPLGGAFAMHQCPDFKAGRL